MKVVKNVEEMKKELLENKEKYLGLTVVGWDGRKYLIVGIKKYGVQVLPMNWLCGKKEEELRELLKEFGFSEEQIERGLKEVEKFKKDIEKSYI